MNATCGNSQLFSFRRQSYKVTCYLQLSNYNVQLTPGAWSDTMDNLDMETFISWSQANVSYCYQFPLIL